MEPFDECYSNGLGRVIAGVVRRHYGLFDDIESRTVGKEQIPSITIYIAL
jgi:hypothetical protein